MEIRIRRARLVSADGRRPLGWVYDYTTPEDITWHHPDGTSRPGPRAGSYVEYGTRLTDLRDMLRRKYGKVALTEEWKA